MEHLKSPFIEFVLHEAIVTGLLRNVLSSCMNYWVEVLREDGERNRMWERARKMVDRVNEQSQVKREGGRYTKSKCREDDRQGTGMLDALCCYRNDKGSSDEEDGGKGEGGVSGDKGVGDKWEGGGDGDKGNGEGKGAKGDSGDKFKGEGGSDGDRSSDNEKRQISGDHGDTTV